MNSVTKNAILVLTLSLCTACGSILTSDKPARQDYLLMPLSLPSAAPPVDAPHLALTLDVVPGLDTDRILALDPDARLNHYANARWADHLPEVLTSVLQRSLASSGLFSSVDGAFQPATADWEISLEVQAFYGIQDASGATARVQFDVMGELKCPETVHSLHLTSSRPVAENRLSAVVAAHQSSLDDVTRQLLARLDRSCGDGSPG